MFKKFILLISTLVLCFGIAACGTEGASPTPSASIYATLFENIDYTEYVTLGQYKGVEISVTRQELTDEDVRDYIESDLENAAYLETVDRPAQEGDTVNISFVGKVDGELFDGGSFDSYDVVIGNGEMIDGFEEGLIGLSAGESKTLYLVFPDNYHVEEMRGVDAEFGVTVKTVSIEITPQYNEDFVKEKGFDSIEEYEKSIKEQIQKTYDDKYGSDKISAAWAVVRSNANIKKYPQEEIDDYKTEMRGYYVNMAVEYGWDLAYMLETYWDLTEEEFEQIVDEYAHEEIGYYLIVRAIAQQEGISFTEQEYKDSLQRYIETWGYSSDEEFKADYGVSFEEYFSLREIQLNILAEKVENFVSENAILK